MIAGIRLVTATPTWKALEAHLPKVRELHLRNLFADDPERGERMTAEAVGLYLDYSKNRITDETLALLLRLAEDSDLRTRIDAPLHPEGWREWTLGKTGSLDKVTYAEYASTGAGASPATREPRSRQLTALEAKLWSRDRFLAGIDGWRP